MFTSVTTVAVYVSDMERAREFYTDVLGFRLSANIHPNLCFLRSDSGKINIYLEGGKKTAGIDADTCRLSFFLEAEDAAQKVYDYLRERGVRLLQKAPEFVGDETYCFQFEDPDGNIIEVAAGP